jgi:hypothetical protein
VTALISVATWDLAGDGDAEAGPPVFSALPAAGSPERDWPGIVSLATFGWWWWDLSRAGFIVRLAPLIAHTSGVVTRHIPTAAVGVHMDLPSPDGWTLPSGVYARQSDLRAGLSIPDLAALHPGQSSVEDAAAGLQREVSSTRDTGSAATGATPCRRG